MRTADAESLVRRWFGQARAVVGPILPDGWFGRPYDNTFFLRDIRKADGKLAIDLGEDTALMITGPCNVVVENSELVFDGFTEAAFCWKEYGGRERLEKRYESGQ